ncbi:MAG: TonB-dependent receptor [Caulobacteraceae bacterium]
MSSTKHRAFLLLSSALSAVMISGVAQAQDAAPAEGTDVQEVVVTGSRIVRSGFTTPTPVTVLGQAQFEQLNVTNVGNVVNQLPAFRPSTTPQTNGFGSFNVGGTFINLRGLGVTRNLVLVDGHRFAPVTREGTVDLNLIPSGLVERTEVVTGGASAAYGSDAIAGVVNIILNKRFNGVKGQVDAGISNEGDGVDYHASIAAGTDFFGGKGHIVFGAEYDKQIGIGSCFTRSWCEPTGSVTNTGVSAVASLPTIVRGDHNTGFLPNQAGVISFLNNSTAATANIRNLFGTGGVIFNTAGQPIAFTQGNPASGTAMIGGDLTASQQFTQVLVPSERHDLYAHGEYDFSDNVRGFLEGSYGHTEGVTLQSVYFGAPISIFADNPFIPAAIRAQIPGAPAASATPSTVRPANTAASFNLARLGDRRGRSSSDADTFRFSGGLNGKFGDRFKWDGYYAYAHTNRTQAVADALVTGASRVINRPGSGGVSDPAALAYFLWATDPVYNPADSALPAGQRRIVCRATISADPALRAAAAGCVPLNPFGQGQASQDSLNYVYRNLVEDISITQHVVAGNVQGELFDLPGGPFAVAAGGEYRRDSTNLVHDTLSNSFAYFQNFGADYRAQQNVIEGYIEGDAPLLKNAPLAKSLSLNGAIRRTHYSISGVGGFNQAAATNTINATSWKAGLVWEPTNWLLLRMTHSRDIRAPNFSELFQASASNFTSVTDRGPGRNNVGAFPPQLSGGNPTLKAEQANTRTFGAVFAPKSGMLERFRLSADYYDIKVNGYIASAGTAQNIIDRCYLNNNQANCALIVRAPSGDLQEIRTVNLNLQWLRTKGVDIEADYRLPLSVLSPDVKGDLSFRALVTIALKQSTNLYGVIVDRSGETGAAGVPDYLINTFATYSNGPFASTLQFRYIPTGLFDASRVGPDQPGYTLTNPNAITDNHVASRIYVNLFASYNLIERGGRRLQLFGSINNLMNTDPPVAPQLGYSTNPVYFDQIGRYFRAGVRFNY